MKNALIIGFGLSGRAAADFLLSLGMKVTAIDAKYESLLNSPEVQKLITKGVNLRGEEQEIGPYDFAVCSPGISPTSPIFQSVKTKIYSEVELAFQHIKQPILGITGTNGKTTVTLLTTHILEFSGRKARALGNVGIPLTSAISTLSPDEIVVAELSSYQLETLHTPSLEASVLLNITPDHLDRRGTMENYAEAKLKLKTITKSPHGFHFHESCKPWVKDGSCYGYSADFPLSTDLKTVFIQGSSVCDLPEMLQNKKNHDLDNFMAAFSLCFTMGVPPEVISQAYNSFVKPHHRIQFITEKNGVKFYDDSKGTNIDAVIKAIESMQGSVHLIAGGVDKGASYLPWTQFQNKIKHIYAIGQAASKIERELKAFIPISLCENLEVAVKKAFENSQAGDNILLSPGCSSFDMFIDYVDRGKAFQKLVAKFTK